MSNVDIVNSDIGTKLKQVDVAVTKLDPPRQTKSGKSCFTDAQVSYQADDHKFHSFKLRIWSADKLPHGMKSGIVIEIGELLVGEYQGNKQYTCDGNEIQIPVQDLDVYMQMIPGSYWDRDYLSDGLQSYVDRINNDQYRELVKRCYQLVGKKLKSEGLSLLKMPAAVGMHHAFVGGLATHTLSMLKAAEGYLTKTIYQKTFDSDLVYAGILLHDLAKSLCYTNELDHEETVAGSLFDHIVLIDGLICRVGEDVYQKDYLDLTTDDIEFMKLRHVVLSHHGKLEWGAPVQPELPEAWLVHQIDTTDAHLEVIREQQEDPHLNEQGFTDKVFVLDKARLYLKK